MERLRALLIDIYFTVYMDCQSLIYINSLKTKNRQIIGWLSSIAEFNYNIFHREGGKMQHVDALSRAPVEEEESLINNANSIKILRRGPCVNLRSTLTGLDLRKPRTSSAKHLQFLHPSRLSPSPTLAPWGKLVGLAGALILM